jgi:hypothetical protein
LQIKTKIKNNNNNNNKINTMVDRIVLNNLHQLHNKKKKVKRLSAIQQLLNTQYYPTAYISKPCDQLFGPQPFEYTSTTTTAVALNTTTSSSCNTSLLDTSLGSTATTRTNQDKSFNSSLASETTQEDVIQLMVVNNNGPTTKGRVVENTTSHGLDADNGKENRQQSQASGLVANTERYDYIPAPKWSKIQNSTLEELFKKSRYPKSSELKLLAQGFHVMDSDIEVWDFLKGANFFLMCSLFNKNIEIFKVLFEKK